MSVHPSRTLSVSIARSAAEVYAFASVPANIPKWASGLGGSIKKENDEWIADTAQGPVRVRFAARNEFGVLDHWVTPAPGVEIYIPMRVIANGDGCELIFTLFRQPGMTDGKFEEDARWVRRDLDALKKLLEA